MNYICLIELNDVTPKIWRKFQFHPNITFEQLHHILQFVMGWENDHLYEFEIKGRRIGEQNAFSGMFFGNNNEAAAESEIVSAHLKRKNAKLKYLYDFGDGWEHTITLIDPKAPPLNDASYPVCLEGARCCPPEDVGGVPGYEFMLEVLDDPEHPEYEHMTDWLGEDYDPERFSIDAVNELLRSDKFVPKPLPRNAPLPKSKPKPAKLTKSALNKYLNQISQDQLIDLVKECFDSSNDVKKLLSVRIIGEDAAISLFYVFAA
ncbi:plasmid pRiA4b ORF-3 family protein [Cohnella algarum]|uniref:plasmid pRiA4b ORF-3 family protein n=1 Tax=Cohnella algarum TaxID=2044859 RepID=UPI0019672675|nr:plasmid pRiA4b ORF-3 family protein [Cohnella algarum]MBN2983229.1 plasmid pRiA4b ORF-3 family protein [Cohnella algarum]